MGIDRLIRPELASIKGYAPVQPLEALSEHSGVSVEAVIKLDGNENPYGCSPRVRQALANYPYYHIYPDPEQRELRKALSEYAGVSPECIVAGSGSNELIDLILCLLLDPGDEAINCPPSFGMYPFRTEVYGGRVVNVPRGEGFTIDIAAVRRAVYNRTKVIFVASPNNPTGNSVPEKDILELVDTGILVVIDEAYFEFSGATVAPLVAQFDNLIVLRTLSKWAGLAGLRIGYGILPLQIATYLMKIKQPYNINAAAQVAVLETLADIDYLRGTIRAIIDERERLFAQLEATGLLHPYPSQANFILCSVIAGEAKKIHQDLRQRKGISLRYFETPLLQNCLRISVGKPEHTDALIEALKEVS